MSTHSSEFNYFCENPLCRHHVLVPKDLVYLRCFDGVDDNWSWSTNSTTSDDCVVLHNTRTYMVSRSQWHWTNGRKQWLCQECRPTIQKYHSPYFSGTFTVGAGDTIRAVRDKPRAIKQRKPEPVMDELLHPI